MKINSGLSIFLLGILLLSLISQSADAQRLKKSRAIPKATEGYVSVGLQLNAMNYFGDIPADVTFTRPGLGAYFSRKISPRMHLRLGLAWGRIEGDDAITPEGSGTYARNLHFRNDISEFSLTGTFDLVPSYGKYRRRASFTPYFFTGIALFHHNPQAKIPTNLGDEWADLQPLGTEGQGQPGYDQPYGKIGFALPVGIGLTFKLDRRWSMSVESGVRFTFFDYLDDVSGEYPNLADLGNPLAVSLTNRTLEAASARNGASRNLEAAFARFGDPITYTGTDGQVYRTVPSFIRGASTRGNPDSQDMYFITGVRFSYIINVGLKCPQNLW